MKAFQEVFEIYYKKVYCFLLKLSGNETFAEDDLVEPDFSVYSRKEAVSRAFQSLLLNDEVLKLLYEGTDYNAVSRIK